MIQPRTCVAYALIAVGLAAHSIVPQPVAACSPAPFRTNPPDGATDVAVDRALIVEGFFDPASLALEDEEGSTIAFALEHVDLGVLGVWAELRPVSGLAPYTFYVLRARQKSPGQLSASVSFTTGASHALEKPAGRVAVMRDAPPDMCTQLTTYLQVCVEDGTNIEVIARAGDQVLLRTLLQSGPGVFSIPRVPDCVELRRRAPNGQRSEPQVICGGDLSIRPWQGFASFGCSDATSSDNSNPPSSSAAAPSSEAGTHAQDADLARNPGIGPNARLAEFGTNAQNADLARNTDPPNIASTQSAGAPASADPAPKTVANPNIAPSTSTCAALPGHVATTHAAYLALALPFARLLTRRPRARRRNRFESFRL